MRETREPKQPRLAAKGLNDGVQKQMSRKGAKIGERRVLGGVEGEKPGTHVNRTSR